MIGGTVSSEYGDAIPNPRFVARDGDQYHVPASPCRLPISIGTLEAATVNGENRPSRPLWVESGRPPLAPRAGLRSGERLARLVEVMSARMLLAACASVALAAPSATQAAPGGRDCFNPNAAPDPMIADCTQIIGANGTSPADLAHAYENRGVAHARKN